MSRSVDKIVNSVLYEGYMLYPYRRSSVKNQHRWNFGLVYPSGMEPSRMQTECLLEGDVDSPLDIEVRFLQLEEDVTERRVKMGGALIWSFVNGLLQAEIRVDRDIVEPGLTRVRVEIVNRTVRDRDLDPLRQTLISTHTILTSTVAPFVSLLDPPDRFRNAVENCRNIGTWPVLVGNQLDRHCMLSSPIILYDYPRVADESPADLYDSTEIDEILTLRILTLTDSEKEEMRRSGERERRLLEHAESLTPEQLLKLHGTMRDIRTGLKPGDRVRLRPKPGGDVFDVALAGRIAIVESVQEDFDNRFHIAVVIEDDPGKDLGMLRQPGHRFFFSADELEVMT